MNIKVILATREVLFGELLSSYLEQSGISVLNTVHNCSELLEKVQEQVWSIDLLLIDTYLPPYGGSDVAQGTLQLNPKVKILLMSGDDVSTIPKDKRIGYISKHLSCSEILVWIREALRGRRVIARQIPEFCMDSGPHYCPSSITPRERDVISLMVQGLNTKEIAFELSITSSTVETHRKHIRKKTGFSSPLGLARFAQSYGLLNRN